MADRKTTRRKTPPDVGKQLSVRVSDEGMRDDLAIMLRAHPDVSDAVRQALVIVSHAYYEAWERGITPRDQVPEIVSVLVQPPRPPKAPDQHV